MLTIRREQLRTLAEDRARRARRELVEQLTNRGLDATYDEARRAIQVRDAAGAASRLDFGEGSVTMTTDEGRTFGFRYDARQRLQAVIDPAGFETTFDHDDRGRLIAVRRGTHSAWFFEFDDEDLLTRLRRPDGTSTQFAHDEAGRVVAVTDGEGGVTEFDYAHAASPRRITDAARSTTSYAYGEDGHIERVIEADGSAHTYTFDVDSGATSIERSGRFLATASVEDSGAERIEYPDGAWTRIRTASGRTVEASNEHSTLRFEYDDVGHVIAEEMDGRVVRYVRNAVGSLIGIVTPDGERITFERDGEHRVRRVIDWSGASYDFSYELSGALGGIRYPNGVVVARSSTVIGLPARLRVDTPLTPARPVLDITWEYDTCDRVISETRPNKRCEFGYDGNGRLVEVTTAAGFRRYELDAVGNRLSDGNGQYEYNALHQLVRRGDETYSYDAEGNMFAGASPKGALECVHNRRSELVESRNPAGVTRYAYDAVGRRIRKEHAGRTTRYVWAGQQLLSETIEGTDGVTRRDYLVLPEHYLTLAMRVDGTPYFLHHGRRQEPLAMTDAAGRVVWSAEYGAFGLAHIDVNIVSQPFRLVGQYHDEETGLHYNLRRYYDAEVGRFLSKDPVGFDGGSLSLYLFCNGDPLNRADPTGELAFLAVVGAIAFGVAIGAAIGGTIEAYSQYRKNPNKPFDWDAIKKEAWKGAVVGAVGTSFGLIAAPVVAAAGAGAAALGASALVVGAVAVVGGGVVGAASAAIEQCADNKLHDRLWDDDMGPAIAIGGGIGALTAGIGAVQANRARRAARVARESEESGRRAQQALRETEEAERRAQQAARDVEEARRLELAKDPAHAGKTSPKTIREADVGLELERQGKLKGPIARDPNPAGAEFIDANGRKWDVKRFNSKYPPEKGGFDVTRDMRKIEGELGKNESVIVDCVDMSPPDVGALKKAIADKGLQDQVIFFP